MIRSFDGAAAIVTGGASGIGRALARELARRGASVTIADRQEEAAAALANEIVEAGGRARSAALDVRDAGEVERLVREMAEAHGRLDYMFNNAGIGIAGPTHLYSLEDWRLILDVNLLGVVHGVAASYPIMRAQGFGHIVNTASMAGLVPPVGVIGYTTTKFAVVGLTRALREEGAGSGVRASVLCPGVIRTSILEGGGRYGRLLARIDPEVERGMFEAFRPMDPSRFAAKALDDVARNRGVIIHPAWWRGLWWLERTSPWLWSTLSRAAWRRTARQLELE